MKQMRKISAIIGTIVVLGGLVGCNSLKSGSENVDDIIYFSLDIDGNKVKVDKDDKNIQEIAETSKLYTDAATRADYTKEYDGEEFTYYTDELRKMYEEYGQKENMAQVIQNSELKIVTSDMEVKSIELYTVNQKECSEAVVDMISLIEHATPEYIIDRKVEIGQKYRRTLIIKMVKENEKWKIEELVNISDRVKVE